MAGPLIMVAITAAVVVGAVVVVGRNRDGGRLPTSSEVNAYGWLVTQWPDQHLLDGYEGPPFHALKRPEITDAFSGTHRGRDFFAANLDYSRSAGGGVIQTTWYAHVAITLAATVPLVEIEPHEPMSGPAGRFARSRPPYGDDRFNRRFRVRTNDDAFAEKIIDGGLSAYLGAMPIPMPLTIEHGEIRTWCHDAIGDDDLLPLLDDLSDAIDAIPADAWPASDGPDVD